MSESVPVIAVPFYLADERLARIEAEHAAGVEGAEEAMQYLRHEAGHAYNYAYRLYDRPDWRQTFGPYSRPYRDRYRADPFSRDHVRHVLGGTRRSTPTRTSPKRSRSGSRRTWIGAAATPTGLPSAS